MAEPLLRAQTDDTIDERRLRWAEARRPLKRVAGRLLYESQLYSPIWRDRAFIALFHRIDDRYPSSQITCTTTLFRQFCDFFARHFHVVSLTTLLERLATGADISRHLAITFDDGYRDNFTCAAAELRKRNLPATFFLTTDFIGTDVTPWWDVELGIRAEWMTWSDVRVLHAQGFELGVHTCTHADCGCISGVDARREIAGAKARLEQEIGAPARHFAFPYGGPERMTEANRAIVREAGFESCFSAHGGIVAPGDSAFRLCRVPVNAWYTSPYQFGFEAARMAMRRPRHSTRRAPASSNGAPNDNASE